MNTRAIAAITIIIGMLSILIPAGISTDTPQPSREVKEWVALTEGNYSFFINSSNDMVIGFDGESYELSSSAPYDPYYDLNSTLRRAVDRAPLWLNDTLVWSFLNLRDMYRMKYAGLLLNESVDGRYLDEIAFTIAYMPADFLDSYLVEGKMVWENVHMMYTVSDDVQYASISDYNLTDGQHSTITYTLPSGNVTMPEEIYYWYVLMPRFGYDTLEYMNPETQKFNFSEDGGVFWRTYLYYNNDTGFPLLKDRLANETYVWNGTRNQVMNNGAVGAITKWEMESMMFGLPDPRKPSPVFIYKDHQGLCGENAYILAAAAKIALIPTVMTITYDGDHAWNEFWERGWHQWEGYSGQIDNPLGEGSPGSVTVFTTMNPDYTHMSATRGYTMTTNLTVRVFDSNETPVDGALIKLFSYPATDLNGSIALLGNLTDVNGETTFEVGVGFSYYVTIRAPIGGPPDETLQAVQAFPIVGPGVDFEFNISISDPMPLQANYEKVEERSHGLRFNVSAEEIDHLTRFYRDPRGYWTEIWKGYEDRTRLTLLFLDDENLSLYQQGMMFWPGGVLNISRGENASIILDQDVDWNILISGMSSPLTRTFASIDIEVSRSIVTPDALILSPEYGSIFKVGEEIFFKGDLDPLQGSYDDYTYKWINTKYSSVYSTERVFLKSFSEGKIEIAFEVWKGGQLLSSAAVRFEVIQPNRPPIAIIDHPKTGRTFEYGDVIHFAAGGSFDIDGDDLLYEWKEIGVNNTLSDQVEFSATFDPGEHTVELNVSDGRGLSSWDLVSFTVLEPNLAPDPYIRSPEEWSIFQEGDLIELNATGTYDPDGDQLEYTWISSLDGVISKLMKESVVLSVGSHQIWLWANDGEFNISTSTQVAVNEKLIIPDEKPVAVISSPSGLIQYFVSDVIEFSANGSYIPSDYDYYSNDDMLLTYMWSMDGTFMSREKTFQLKLGKGIHQVKLTVGAGNLSDTDTVTILVSDRTPTIEFYIDGLERTDDIFLNVSANENISFDGTRSKDPDGGILTYNWSVDGEMMSDEPVWIHSFEPGSYLVQLTVMDEGGNRMSHVIQINSIYKGGVVIDDEPVEEDEGEKEKIKPLLLIVPIVIIAVCIVLILLLTIQTRRLKDEELGGDNVDE